MTLGWIIMIVIIVIDIIAMIFVLGVGSRHDKHQETDVVTSSDALTRLKERGVKIVDSQTPQS